MTNNIIYPEIETVPKLTKQDIDTLNEDTMREDAEQADRDDDDDEYIEEEENY